MRMSRTLGQERLPWLPHVGPPELVALPTSLIDRIWPLAFFTRLSFLRKYLRKNNTPPKSWFRADLIPMITEAWRASQGPFTHQNLDLALTPSSAQTFMR